MFCLPYKRLAIKSSLPGLASRMDIQNAPQGSAGDSPETPRGPSGQLETVFFKIRNRRQYWDGGEGGSGARQNERG